MSRKIIMLAAIIFIAAGCNKIYNGYAQATVTLANKNVYVDVADTPAKQELGLGGRASLSDSQGMLFPFSPAQAPSFWMKGMLFNIDIIWIKDNLIVQINANAPAQPSLQDAALPLYFYKAPVDYVLELSTGWASRSSLKVGDKIEIKNLTQ